MEPSELSHEDLIRVVKRDRWVKDQQAMRISGLLTENLELMSIIQELQEDLNTAREQIAAALGNGFVPDGAPHPEVLADVTS